MSEMNNIPFVSNHPDNTHCVMAVFRMLHRYFLGSDLSWEEVDRIGRKVPGKGTWTIPFEIYLSEKGIPLKSIESVDYGRLGSEGTEYLREAFGPQNFEYYIRKSNLSEVLDLIPRYVETVRHETRKATMEDILGALENNKLVWAEVDAGRLNGKRFDLHAVLLYATDRKTVTFHDPGLPPRPGRMVSTGEFQECFAYPGAGCGIMVIG